MDWDALEESVAVVVNGALFTRSKVGQNAWRDTFKSASGNPAPDVGLVQELSLVLEGLSSSLTDSGFPLAQCVPKLARRLMWLAREHDSNKLKGEEAGSVQQLYEEMVEMLIEAVEDDDLMVAAPDHHLPFFSWAVTWMKLHLLLPGQDEIVSKEGMESQASWLALLDCLWPDDGSCPRTKMALDSPRRELLFECGHHAQALAGFAMPGVWRGFEKCHFWMLVGGKYARLHRFDQALDWARQAEKAALDPDLKSHELQPYMLLATLSAQVPYLSCGKWTKLATDMEARYLSVAGKVDLQLRFDHSDLDKMKVQLLIMQATFMTRATSKHCLRGLTAIRELSSDQLVSVEDSLGIQEGTYWWLHGVQLLLLGHVQDAEKAFNRILRLLPAMLRHEAISMRHVLSASRTPVERPFCFERIIAVCQLYLWSRSTGQTLEGTDAANTSDSQGHGPISRAYNHYTELLLAWCSGQATADAGASLWQSWYDVLIKLVDVNGAYKGSLSEVVGTDRLIPYGMRCIFLLHVHLLQMTYGVPVAWPPPPQLGIAHNTSSKQAFIDDCALRVVVYAERLRPYSVLWQLNSTGGVTEQRESAEDLDRDWEMVTEARLNCGPDTIFLHYLDFVRPAFVSILHPDGAVSCLELQLVETCELELVERTAERIISSMTTDHDESLQQQDPAGSSKSTQMPGHLEWLYDLLIRPVFMQLGFMEGQPTNPQRKLVIVTNGQYFSKVPFSILRNKETGKYLFQEVTLSVTPSFRLLHQCQIRYEELQKRPLFGPGPGSAVAIGAPAYKKPTEALPGSGKEVKQIRDLFNAAGGRHQVQMLLEEKATVDAFLGWTVEKTRAHGAGKPGYSQAFIHIAAHGQVDPHVPRGALRLAESTSAKAAGHGPDRPTTSQQGGFPAMLLSEGTTARLMAIAEEEAILASRASHSTLHELDSSAGFLPSHWILHSGKEWSAYVVVLSCCNSGIGQVVSYGTLNLGRAFLFQGIPCCILSLWAVDDTTTADLMLLFYKALREGQDVSSGLRSAMLTMLDMGCPLRHLAPFFVCGLPTVRLPPEMRTGACTGKDS